MRINQILLIPGAGHSDDFGQYHRGASTERIAEVDVVDSYVQTLADILDEYQIRHEVLPTRKPPGIPAAARLSTNESNTLKMELSVGFFIVGRYGKPRERNETIVEYSGEFIRPIAEMMCESLSEYGRCCSYGHRTCNPILNKDLAEGCIRVKPFAINGPDVDVFAEHAPAMGKGLGLAIVEALRVSGEASRGAPARL